MYIAFIFLAVSCAKEEVDIGILDIKEAELYDIVIEGGIVTEKAQYKIRLSKPAKFSDSEFAPINNAVVKLSDGENYYYYENVDTAGIYKSIDSISAKVDTKYTLIVEYENRIYYASDSVVLCEPEFDLPIVLGKATDDFYEFDISIHNFGLESPSLWLDNESSNSNGGLINRDIQAYYNIYIYNHVGSIPQGIFPTTFYSTGVSGFERDSVEFIKMSISDDYYEYIISQFNISEWSSGIFATIPGNAKTNVSKGGTGYFYCTDVISYRMTYKDLYEMVK